MMAPIFELALLHALMLVTQGSGPPQATVSGTVRDDETRMAVPGAAVALPELNRAVTADTNGRYLLSDVPPGPHHITIRRIGYASRTLHAFVPSAGRLEINVLLRAEPVRLATIEARRTVPVRGIEPASDDSFPDRHMSIGAIRHHPLLAEPDVLLALNGGDVTLAPEAPSGMHIRGGASDQTGYLLDGIPVFSPYHAGGLVGAWNPDAVSAVRLSAVPGLGSPHVLSGVVAATTRAPEARMHAMGSLSTVQTRLTVDGPLGVAGAGYLVSARSSFPGVIAPNGEASYLRGGTRDWLGKLEVPVLNGTARVLAYRSTNTLNTAAAVEADVAPDLPLPRHTLGWHSGSIGAEWSGPVFGNTVRVTGWSAAVSADARWTTRSAPLPLAASRHDLGLQADIEHVSGRGRTIAGIRLEGIRTSYRVSTGVPSWDVSTPIATAFAQHMMTVGRRVTADLGFSLADAGGRLYAGPRIIGRWTPSDVLTVSGSYIRTHQFAQSLRNPESVVGAVFPVDLYVSTGRGGVPVASSDQGTVAVAYRPTGSFRLGAQAYARRLDGLLLVAPHVGEPFATTAGVNGFVTGAGISRGVSIDLAATAAQYGVVASYGIQHLQLQSTEGGYVPTYGATHQVEVGAIVFPTPTWSIRIGATGIFHRRGTMLADGVEWESCNLLDRGCEFAGSPRYDGAALGATPLPSYVRFDLGIRKHWHLRIGGRDAQVALFGTVTNLFNRKNVLGYIAEPSSDALDPIEMRPFAPLVFGVDWQF